MSDICEIEYCDKSAKQTLTVNTDGQFLAIGFCLRHAVYIESRLEDLSGKEIDLFGGMYTGTAGELTEAIDYVDALAAADVERGN
jgi:hypothetical protein